MAMKFFLLLVFTLAAAHAQTISTPAEPANDSQPSLADLLARAPQLAGPPPSKFDTPFLVMKVMPEAGSNTCYIEVVTNGMYFTAGANNRLLCHHLPALHSIVWGKAAHSVVYGSYLQLVYQVKGTKVKTEPYQVSSEEAINADWGKNLPANF